jgi:hypothetical protein
MPRPNNRSPVNLTPKYRMWASGSSRDERIDGSPARGHTAKWVEKKVDFYQCVRCDAPCVGPAMFCEWHLSDVVLRP